MALLIKSQGRMGNFSRVRSPLCRTAKVQHPPVAETVVLLLSRMKTLKDNTFVISDLRNRASTLRKSMTLFVAFRWYRDTPTWLGGRQARHLFRDITSAFAETCRYRLSSSTRHIHVVRYNYGRNDTKMVMELNWLADVRAVRRLFKSLLCETTQQPALYVWIRGVMEIWNAGKIVFTNYLRRIVRRMGCIITRSRGRKVASNIKYVKHIYGFHVLLMCLHIYILM